MSKLTLPIGSGLLPSRGSVCRRRGVSKVIVAIDVEILTSRCHQALSLADVKCRYNRRWCCEAVVQNGRGSDLSDIRAIVAVSHDTCTLNSLHFVLKVGDHIFSGQPQCILSMSYSNGPLQLQPEGRDNIRLQLVITRYNSSSTNKCTLVWVQVHSAVTVCVRLANGVLTTNSLFIILCLAFGCSPNLEHLDSLFGRTNSKYRASIWSDT